MILLCLKTTVNGSLEVFTDTAIIVVISHRTEEKLFCDSFNTVYTLFHHCVYF